ncbi:MAG: CPBP family intramembrane metalloprotease [Ruminococcaceae bacterium]|nr:CPBP family intramembrane metalloprotease [Oscillospiraceae bacterium]
MEDKAFRRGLSVAAIVLIVISAVLLTLTNTNGLLYGSEAVLYGVPFVAAAALPLLAVLLILTQFYTRTDTIEEMLGAIAVRYAIFGWCFVFVIKLASILLSVFFYDFYTENFATIYIVLNSINVCVIGTTVLALALRKLPVTKIEKKPMKIGQLLLLIMMMYGLTQVGSLMGMPIHLVLTTIGSMTADSEDAAAELSNNLVFSSGTVIRIISIGILPAIFEELLFRKFLIDRTIRHGEFISCAMSGIMFGLWHGNFQQFFFAFFIGVLFAFVYIRTGNIIYTMIMHASMNLVTSTVTVELFNALMKSMGIDMATGNINANIDDSVIIKSVLPMLLLLLLWIGLLVSFQIVGFIMLIVKRKKFKLAVMPGEPARKAILHSMTHSVEMWIFFSFALLLFVYQYIPDIIATIIELNGK